MHDPSDNPPKGPGSSKLAPAVSPEGAGPWFERAFDDFYASLYAHRSDTEAVDLVTSLRRRGLVGPVLDVACGAGRLLRTLQSQGMTAYGFDLSRDLLRRAADASERSAADPFPGVVCSDMRRWPFATGRAGTAIMLFTSFGYFDSRAEDLQVLREAARALRPKGRFVLDFLNRKRTEEDLIPRSERQVSGRIVIETRRIDHLTSEGPYVRKQVQVSRPDPADPQVSHPEASYEERVRLYAPEELGRSLETSGFRVEEMWGDYQGAAFDEDHSKRCIVLAQREGDS